MRGITQWENTRISVRSIAGSPIRSALTALGVMIGVAAVIILVALGRGAQTQVERSLNSLGANLLIVYSGEPRGTALVRSNTANIRPTLTEDDLAMIRAMPPELVSLSTPASTANVQLKFENRNIAASVVGTGPEYPDIRNFQPIYGTFFTHADLERRAAVVLLGAQVYRDLFDAGRDPIGENVRINGVSYRVLGVMEEKGSAAQDSSVLIPISTFQRRISGESNYAMISIQAASSEVMHEVQAAIEQQILRLHRLPSMDYADFYIANQMDLLSTVAGVAGTFTLLLASIAGISLVVGGVGIMNIMLVSVTERTREIGVRMALGARPRDITAQFLTEAVVLALGGGAIGIALGIGGSWVAVNMARTAAEVSIASVGAAFGFSVIIGLFFGGYPAWRASQLDPIEALRYE
ncbi:MAG: FtsX-like permease family protein [Spirochaetaceae bacterium]|nr:MAG: FtsX-like permease family protein [Spirochaetaceae bacterium]